MSQLKRRLWFYGTWLRLAVTAVFAVVFIAFLGYAGFFLLQHSRYLEGLCFLGLGLALLFLYLHRVHAFRRNLRAGMQSELKRRQYCPHCEYDLRASFTRCPECGQPIANTVEM